MNFAILSWTFGLEGGSVRNPGWQSIDEKLRWLEKGSGTITLDGEGEDGCQNSLQVRFEDLKYLLTFGYEKDNDWVVQIYQNTSSSEDEIMLLGDIWRKNCICWDAEIVRQAFKRFYDVGTIPDNFVGDV